MIFSAPVRLERGLGDSSDAVKQLQSKLVALFQATGNADYGGGIVADGSLESKGSETPHGDGWWTVRALYKIAIAFSDKIDIPGVGDLISFINGKGGLSVLRGLWITNAGGARTWIQDKIRSAANKMAVGVNAVVTYVVSGDTAPPPASGGNPYRKFDIDAITVTPGGVITPDTAGAGLGPSGYPLSAFAVRDPSTSKYRILVPLKG
jgi:hypothetical protein